MEKTASTQHNDFIGTIAFEFTDGSMDKVLNIPKGKKLLNLELSADTILGLTVNRDSLNAKLTLEDMSTGERMESSIYVSYSELLKSIKRFNVITRYTK